MANAATTNFGTPAPYVVVRDNLGTYFLVSPSTKTRYRITGSGQLQHAQTLWGQARTTDGNGQPIYLTGFNEPSSVVDLYGGPGGIDAVVEGTRRDPLTGSYWQGAANTTPSASPSTAPAGTVQTGAGMPSSAPTVVVTAPTPNSPGSSNTTNPDYITNPPVSGGNAPSPVFSPINPVPETMDFTELAKALYPWMPPALLAIFVDAWNTYGDERIAWGRVRSDPRYDEFFPGNRRDDGSLRYSETEYLAVRDGYRQVIADAGLNPDVFESKFTGLIQGDVSLNEFQYRVSGAVEGLIGNTEATKAWYAENYGIQLTDAALLASVIDPDVGRDIVDRRIAVSQVGGEAMRFGFDRSIAQADRLVGAGVDQRRAREVYAQAGAQLPTFQAMSTRFRDPDSTFDLTEFEDAAVFTDPDQLRRIRGLLGRESSLFSPQGLVRRDSEGLLSGLLAR